MKKTGTFFLIMLLLAVAVEASAKNTSHEGFIARYEGPKTCEKCHSGVVNEVIQSVHYKLKGPVSTIKGLSGEWGEINRECGLPGSIYKINAGCKQCHIGNGSTVTDQPTARERDGIDCLICHATKYDYSRRAVVPTPDTPEGFRVTQDRSLESARSVGGRPTSEACFRCHNLPAGGLWWKRGINFSPERDVHVAKGMTCVDCHKAEKHKFPNGNDPGGWAKETTTKTLSCANCHADVKHKNPAVNNHLSRISCNVCHIPTIGGVVTRDYVHVVKNSKTGMFVPKADQFDHTYSTKPTYRFFNGMGTQQIEPIGSVSDPKSKITAFKPLTTIAPRDAKTKKLLFQNLAVLFKTGSVDQALAQGFKQKKQEYSGAWEPVTLTGYFILSHDITKTKALTCNACHSTKDYIGFGALGYSKERVKQLTNQADPRYH
ncbi:MAG: cytochrome c3 family protein [Syntrophales bacterium]|nr:cytochrome c3 family protein [Syntrophales bacterium]